MKRRLLLIERKPSHSVSIERVFREIVKHLPPDEFEIDFQQVPFGNGVVAIARNLLFFRPRDADIYHVTGDIHYITLRLPRNKVILTIHDLIFLHRRSGLRRAVLKKLFLDLPIRASSAVTTVSEATRREVVVEASVDAPTIAVIDDPLIGGFVPDDRPFDVDSPRILQIGTAVNKNLRNLVVALRGEPCQLTIVGPLAANDMAMITSAGIDFVNKPTLDADAIVDEYRKADIVTYCSTYEGFGLPILEAQAMGRPVITSRLAPMDYVAGKGAMLVDPLDPLQIRAAVRKLVEDAQLRKDLITAGFENIGRFAPQRIAGEYLAVYNKLLGPRRDA